jgi:hypothetical protein
MSEQKLYVLFCALASVIAVAGVEAGSTKPTATARQPAVDQRTVDPRAAHSNIEVESLTIYNGGDVFQRRVPGVKQFAAYTWLIEDAVDQVWRTAKPDRAQYGQLVLGLKPNGQRRHWLRVEPGPWTASRSMDAA